MLFRSTLMRLLDQKLNRRWRQQIVIETRPGGGALIGMELAARAQGDGYALLATDVGWALISWLTRALAVERERWVNLICADNLKPVRRCMLRL